MSSQTNAQIVTALLEGGHAVSVITAWPNRPSGRLFPGYQRQLYKKERKADRLELVRCFTTLSPESSLAGRFLENVSFGLTSGLATLVMRRPDVIYANTWPIFATGLLWLIARLRRVPLVMSVQDVYPESLVSQNRIRSDGWLARCLTQIDRFIARRCRAVIVISESFAAIYRDERGVPADRIHVIPNWVDSQSVIPDDPQAAAVRARFEIAIADRLVVYGGNVGVAAGVETLIESFQYLKDVPNMCLLVAGEGSRLTACQEQAHTVGNDRITFYTPWPKSDTSCVLGAADILVLPTKGQQSLASVPSKLITYMLAARPIIALALPESDLARTIEVAGCGWIVPPDQPEQLATKIREVAKLPATELTQRGQAGRDYALKNFTGEACLPKVIQVLEQAADLLASSPA